MRSHHSAHYTRNRKNNEVTRGTEERTDAACVAVAIKAGWGKTVLTEPPDGTQVQPSAPSYSEKVSVFDSRVREEVGREIAHSLLA